MLLDLDKGILSDMGIKVMGDVIGILKQAKKVPIYFISPPSLQFVPVYQQVMYTGMLLHVFVGS